jgi:hypothetical protein
MDEAKTYVVYVCPECREQISGELELDKDSGTWRHGHYHDPPEAWPGDEDPWLWAVEIQTVAVESQPA